ncbi:hypothetical protein GCM10027037_27590 [Mucilaginibacter koreensis]
MTIEEEKYHLSTKVYRQLAKKVTENLRFLYLDIDLIEGNMLITAFYRTAPNEIELELLDDIATNSNAPIANFYVDYTYKLMSEHNENEVHDFLIFAFYDESEDTLN